MRRCALHHHQLQPHLRQQPQPLALALAHTPAHAHARPLSSSAPRLLDALTRRFLDRLASPSPSSSSPSTPTSPSAQPSRPPRIPPLPLPPSSTGATTTTTTASTASATASTTTTATSAAIAALAGTPSWEAYSDLIDRVLDSSHLSIVSHRRLFDMVVVTPTVAAENLDAKIAALHSILARLGPAANPVQYRSLALLLAQKRDMPRLLRLFNHMHALGVAGPASLYAVLVRALVANGCTDAAMQLFAHLRTVPHLPHQPPAVPASLASSASPASPFPRSAPHSSAASAPPEIHTPHGHLVLLPTADTSSLLPPQPHHSLPPTLQEKSCDSLPRPGLDIYATLIADHNRRGDHAGVDALVAALRSDRLDPSPQIHAVMVESFVKRRLFSAANAAHERFLASSPSISSSSSSSPSSSSTPLPSPMGLGTAAAELRYLRNIAAMYVQLRMPEKAFDALARHVRVFGPGTSSPSASSASSTPQSTQSAILPLAQVYRYLVAACDKQSRPDLAIDVLAHYRASAGTGYPFLDMAETVGRLAARAGRTDLLRRVNALGVGEHGNTVHASPLLVDLVVRALASSTDGTGGDGPGGVGEWTPLYETAVGRGGGGLSVDTVAACVRSAVAAGDTPLAISVHSRIWETLIPPPSSTLTSTPASIPASTLTTVLPNALNTVTAALVDALLSRGRVADARLVVLAAAHALQQSPPAVVDAALVSDYLAAVGRLATALCTTDSGDTDIRDAVSLVSAVLASNSRSGGGGVTGGMHGVSDALGYHVAKRFDHPAGALCVLVNETAWWAPSVGGVVGLVDALLTRGSLQALRDVHAAMAGSSGGSGGGGHDQRDVARRRAFVVLDALLRAASVVSAPDASGSDDVAAVAEAGAEAGTATVGHARQARLTDAELAQVLDWMASQCIDLAKHSWILSLSTPPSSPSRAS